MDNPTKGILLVFSTAIISGISIYVNGLAVKFSNPYIFTGIKNLLVGLAFLSLILLIKEWKSIKALKRADWIKLILIGLVGGAIPFLLFFKGLSLTTAVKGSFIQKTMFIYVGFLAIIFLKEKLNSFYYRMFFKIRGLISTFASFWLTLFVRYNFKALFFIFETPAGIMP